MSASNVEPLMPTAMRREGEHLVIEWSDGVVGRLGWKMLRDACPCAGCREDHQKPADPFRILKPAELVPLAAVTMPRVGRYAYKIVWSDGHDSGIYTLHLLRELSLSSTHPR